jgi:hypothetical protein
VCGCGHCGDGFCDGFLRQEMNSFATSAVGLRSRSPTRVLMIGVTERSHGKKKCGKKVKIGEER